MMRKIENKEKSSRFRLRVSLAAAFAIASGLAVPMSAPAYGTSGAVPIHFHLTPFFFDEPRSISDPEAGSFHTILATLILEAVGEGHKAMVAVGEVIRHRSTMFESGWDTICASPYQFSGWNDRRRALKFLAAHKDYYSAALDAWTESEFTDTTNGATEYHAKYVRPSWARDYKRVARIGSHIFYRRPPPKLSS